VRKGASRIGNGTEEDTMSDMARTMTIAQQPLNDDERSELRTFLSSDAMPDDSLDFSGLVCCGAA
jgi:hypothetical protein